MGLFAGSQMIDGSRVYTAQIYQSQKTYNYYTFSVSQSAAVARVCDTIVILLLLFGRSRFCATVRI